MLSKLTNFTLKKFNTLFNEGHTNYRAHGGVAFFIHETIPNQKLILSIRLQAIAARINIGRDVNIVSIYNSQSHAISENFLSTLFQQIPKPVILTGDFNIYHLLWGGPAKVNRVCQVLSFINKNQLNLLNDGRHTGTSGTSNLAIDVTIAPPSLQPVLSWNVTDSPLSSCVITVNIQSKT